MISSYKWLEETLVISSAGTELMKCQKYGFY